MEQVLPENPSKKNAALPINAKSLARIVAVQTIYSCLQDATESSQDYSLLQRLEHIDYQEIGEVYRSHLEQEVKKDVGRVRIHAKTLEGIAHAITNHIPFIGSIVGAIKQNHSANPVLESILICAIAERIFNDTVPYQILINEYTDIASELLNSKEVGFVNLFLQNNLAEFSLK